MRTALLTALLLATPAAGWAGDYADFDTDFAADAHGAKPYRSSYLLAGICEVVYDKKNKRKKKWARMGLSEVSFKNAKQHDAQAAVVRSDDYIFVTIRGTKTAKDALQDIRAPQDHRWSKEQIKVHAGFGDQAKALYPWVVKTLKANKGNRKVWVTGHSLGGAVANLIAYRLVRDARINVDGVMTFAAPRVSGKKWKKKYDAWFPSTSYRWVNGQDPIPHEPSGKSWHAVGKRHVIRKGKKINFGGKSPKKDWTQFGKRHGSTKYLRALWKGMPSSEKGNMPRPGLIAPD